ncbi:uncharacterized protein SCHCODRAFT_02716569, partial [Schizophyllum commune H4-8]|uniref:uncharacterized protein n=1 Tax=Schizophyllum commune (strain H4-8 / FGSC 9210) TaxID=578458 RepID=UPI002160DA49
RRRRPRTRRARERARHSPGTRSSTVGAAAAIRATGHASRHLPRRKRSTRRWRAPRGASYGEQRRGEEAWESTRARGGGGGAGRGGGMASGAGTCRDSEERASGR